MKKIYFLIALLFPFCVSAQSLGKERVDRLRNSVVKVLIDGKQVGTGFFISSDGGVLTSWSVIESAVARNAGGGLFIQEKISIEFMDGYNIGIKGLPKYILGEDNPNAVGYDYCLLVTDSVINHAVSPLRIGKFENVSEGDLVYTCGFPSGMKQQFMSTGMLSTKFKDSMSVKNIEKEVQVTRDVAWLDLTMNKGNNGGPIIKAGKTPREDEVIGIATFSGNEYAQAAKKAFEMTGSSVKGMQSNNGFSQQDIDHVFAYALMNSFYGISGCVSIDYFKSFVEKYYHP